MKGVQGLVIAAALGITGAVCNWLYIKQQADNYERVALLALNESAQLEPGDTFREDQFVKVEIPKLNLGNLDTRALKWGERASVANMIANRKYRGGEILLIQDLQTPAVEDLSEKVGPDETVLFFTVDPRTFNPQHVNPGNLVSFRIPAIHSTPVPAGSDENAGATIIGAFRILALGNRKGRRNIHQASGLKSGSENMIAISAELRAGKLEPKAQRLSDIFERTGFKGVQILLHSTVEKKKK